MLTAAHTLPSSSCAGGVGPQLPVDNRSPTCLQMMARRRNWLTSIKSWQEEFLGTLSAQEFVTCVTHDLLVSRLVFVFTPSGDLMRMPKVSFLSAGLPRDAESPHAAGVNHWDHGLDVQRAQQLLLPAKGNVGVGLLPA